MRTIRTIIAIAMGATLGILILSPATAASVRYIKFDFPETIPPNTPADMGRTTLLCWCGNCNLVNPKVHLWDNLPDVEDCGYGRVNGAQFPNNYTTRTYWGGRYNLHEACNWMCMHRRNNTVHHDISQDKCYYKDPKDAPNCTIWNLKLENAYSAPYTVYATEPSGLVSSRQPDAPPRTTQSAPRR